MATMSLDNQIKKFLPQLGNDEKESLISVIKSFLKLRDVPPPVQRLTIEEYNKLLDEAEARIDAGQFFTQEEVEEMSKQW